MQVWLTASNAVHPPVKNPRNKIVFLLPPHGGKIEAPARGEVWITYKNVDTV